jgi:hypothetical protein
MKKRTKWKRIRLGLGPAGEALRKRTMRTKEGRLMSEQARVAVEAAANLGLALDATGVSRIELARRLGIDRAGVTRLLQGGNVGIERIAAAAHVLGLSAHVSIGPATEEMHVFQPSGYWRPKAPKYVWRRE